jgi:hypothetical protein
MSVPTEPGWYWCRLHGLGHWLVVRVLDGGEDNELEAWTDGRPWSLDCFTDWSERIEEPKEAGK